MTAHAELRELRDILVRRRDDLRAPIEAENAHDYCVLWSNGLNEAIREIDRLLAKPEAGDREKRIEEWRLMAYAMFRHHDGGRDADWTNHIHAGVTLMREGGAPADGELVAAAEAILPFIKRSGEGVASRLRSALAAVRARGGKQP